jgi:hypothetical protein
MTDPYNVAVLVLALMGVAHFAHSLFTCRNRNRYRHEWFCYYGCHTDPVNTVWLARNQDHDERQRKLDASQNVMTRLL